MFQQVPTPSVCECNTPSLRCCMQKERIEHKIHTPTACTQSPVLSTCRGGVCCRAMRSSSIAAAHTQHHGHAKPGDPHHQTLADSCMWQAAHEGTAAPTDAPPLPAPAAAAAARGGPGSAQSKRAASPLLLSAAAGGRIVAAPSAARAPLATPGGCCHH